jgi:hypothetical protein
VDVMSIEDVHHQLGGLEVLGAELVCQLHRRQGRGRR